MLVQPFVKKRKDVSAKCEALAAGACREHEKSAVPAGAALMRAFVNGLKRMLSGQADFAGRKALTAWIRSRAP